MPRPILKHPHFGTFPLLSTLPKEDFIFQNLARISMLKHLNNFFVCLQESSETVILNKIKMMNDCASLPSFLFLLYCHLWFLSTLAFLNTIYEILKGMNLSGTG